MKVKRLNLILFTFLAGAIIGSTIAALVVRDRTKLPTHRAGTSVVKVAAIGDSITYGFDPLMNDRSTHSYPAELEVMLGSSYKVNNYGRPGATLLDSGDTPYRKDVFYKQSTQNQPNIVLIMLGTNDAKSTNWNAAKYEEQLKKFVATYQNLKSKPTVYLMTPPALYSNTAIDPEVVSAQVVPIVFRVAKETNVKLVNIYDVTKNHPELFPDAIHPSDAGYKVIARAVYKAVHKSPDTKLAHTLSK
jgi:lysophospholipase L1-like esterase